MKGISSAIFAAAIASLALVGCNRGGENLAVVNNEPISMEEFHRYLEHKPLVQVVDDQGQTREFQVAASLGFQALRDLISRRILLQIAKDDGVFPTDADVQAELDFRVKQRADFIRSLQAQGLDIVDIKRELTQDLAKERIITKGITVTDAEVDKWIKDNPKAFETPPQAKLRMIVVRDENSKKQVDTELSGGKPFSQVAVQYSVAPNVRQTQGQIPIMNVPQMPQALQTIVSTTSEGKASDWKLDSQPGAAAQWVKIFVEQKTPAKTNPVTDIMRQDLRRKMAMDQGGRATDLGKRVVEKLKAAKIDVSQPSLKTLWDNVFKSLQEQDVNTSTASTPGGAAGAPGAGATPGGDNKPK